MAFEKAIVPSLDPLVAYNQAPFQDRAFHRGTHSYSEHKYASRF